MAAPDPVGPQSAPSHMRAHQECGWKDGVQAVHKSTVNSLDRGCLLMEAGKLFGPTIFTLNENGPNPPPTPCASQIFRPLWYCSV